MYGARRSRSIYAPYPLPTKKNQSIQRFLRAIFKISWASSISSAQWGKNIKVSPSPKPQNHFFFHISATSNKQAIVQKRFAENVFRDADIDAQHLSFIQEPRGIVCVGLLASAAAAGLHVPSGGCLDRWCFRFIFPILFAFRFILFPLAPKFAKVLRVSGTLDVTIRFQRKKKQKGNWVGYRSSRRKRAPALPSSTPFLFFQLWNK